MCIRDSPEAEPDIKLEKLHESQSFFEMLGEYILAGFKVAMIILAMLIGFIALISAVNALFSSVFGMSFQQILGYVFYPLAWLVGIPLSDALNAGSIMAVSYTHLCNNVIGQVILTIPRGSACNAATASSAASASTIIALQC